MLSKIVAVENEKHGIASVAITPGIVDTHMYTTFLELGKECLAEDDLAWHESIKSEIESAPVVSKKLASLAVNGVPRGLSGKVICWKEIKG